MPMKYDEIESTGYVYIKTLVVNERNQDVNHSG